MLYTKIQPQSVFGSEEENFQVFLLYMGMAAILVNGAEPFEQIVNILSTGSHMWNLMKIAQAVSEKKTFKNIIMLYMYIAQGQGQITHHRGQNFDCNLKVTLL